MARSRGQVDPIHVTAFTRWMTAPSSRFRIRQYLPQLESEDILVTDHQLPDIRDKSGIAKIQLGMYMTGLRAVAALKSYRTDLSLFSKEILPGFCSFERLVRRPRVLDVDDAIWLHRRGGQFAWKVASHCDAIICGNSFLADRFAAHNPNIFILPSGVDSGRFVPSTEREGNFVIGWSGTSRGMHWLYGIEDVLSEVLREIPGSRLRVLADKMPAFSRIPAEKVDFVKWSEHVEVSAIQSMDVGLMPLDEGERSKGKCSYKMLLYMSCGIPVVASPVGMNVDVLGKGNVGFAAGSGSDWFQALVTLSRSRELRESLGREARTVVRKNYDSVLIGRRLAQILRGEVERRAARPDREATGS